MAGGNGVIEYRNLFQKKYNYPYPRFLANPSLASQKATTCNPNPSPPEMYSKWPFLLPSLQFFDSRNIRGAGCRVKNHFLK